MTRARAVRADCSSSAMRSIVFRRGRNGTGTVEQTRLHVDDEQGQSALRTRHARVATRFQKASPCDSVPADRSATGTARAPRSWITCLCREASRTPAPLALHNELALLDLLRGSPAVADLPASQRLRVHPPPLLRLARPSLAARTLWHEKRHVCTPFS